MSEAQAQAITSASPKFPAVEAFPGCPSLSWMLAKRVCNPYEEADAFIVMTGRKGSGKSTASLAIAEDTARCIAALRCQGEDPEKFFNIEHVVTVTKEGTIRLLTSGILQKRNGVIILDDVSLQWNSRDSMSWINKALNDILMVARVYQCVIISNTVQSGYLDKVARELSDFRIRVMSKSTFNKQSFLRCYYWETSETGDAYRHHLTWHGHRIKTWVCGLPSEKIIKQYHDMRVANTDEHLKATYSKVKIKLDGAEPVKKKTKEQTFQDEHMEAVRRDFISGKYSISKLARKYGTSRTQIGYCIKGLE